MITPLFQREQREMLFSVIQDSRVYFSTVFKSVPYPKVGMPYPMWYAIWPIYPTWVCHTPCGYAIRPYPMWVCWCMENSPLGKFAAGKFAAWKIHRAENLPRENTPLGKFATGKFAARNFRRGSFRWFQAKKKYKNNFRFRFFFIGLGYVKLG